VRLVLALASVALVALLISGVTLSQIIPGYLEEQAHQQLTTAANGTGLLIRLRSETRLDQSPDDLANRGRREAFLTGVASDATVAFSVGSIQIINALDGSQAAAAQLPETYAAQLVTQGLQADTAVRPLVSTEIVRITVPAAEPGLTQAGAEGSFILPLKLVIGQPYTTEALTLSRISTTLMVVGILTLALSALLGFFLARRLTGPMNRLRRISARLSMGELDHRATPSGVIEIDQLGAQFNVMADRLSESLRLLEADRDRLREFIADVSHELRTPIAALRTFNDLQRDGTVDEPTRIEFLERSSEQLRRLEWLSTNLLDLSRIEAGIFPLDVREGDLRDPIRSVVEAHAEVAEERGVALVAAVPSEAVSQRFDRERIVQLVNNLVGNALKFTPRGGEVFVELTSGVDEAIIEVRDTGPGIPASELPRIFERFYRGTNVGEARASGSGLGLAIARSIVEMHAGSIEVASAVGEGSSFRVHLPRLSEPVPSETAAAGQQPAAGPRVIRRLRRPLARRGPRQVGGTTGEP
jgi:signal transduction histidine kinase